MKKVTIFSLVCLLAASGIGLAWEHRGGEGLKIPHGKWWRMPEMVKKLGLTSEEQQKFDDLFVQSRRRLGRVGTKTAMRNGRSIGRSRSRKDER